MKNSEEASDEELYMDEDENEEWLLPSKYFL